MLDALRLQPTTSGRRRGPNLPSVFADCTSCSTPTECSRNLVPLRSMLHLTSRNTLAATKEPMNTISRACFCQTIQRGVIIIFSEGLRRHIRTLATSHRCIRPWQPKHLPRPVGRLAQKQGPYLLPAQARNRPVLPDQARQNRVPLEE